jgi:hypothetical protein
VADKPSERAVNYHIFLIVMSYPSLVVISPILYFCQHNSLVVVFLLPGEKEFSRLLSTESTAIRFLFCLSIMKIHLGGLLGSTDPSGMLISKASWMNSGRSVPIVPDLGC